MEQLRVIFQREFESGIKPDLQTGVGGTFPARLRFKEDPSFFTSVAAAAKRSLVCAQSGVRAFLYLLPDLRQQIGHCLHQHADSIAEDSTVALSGNDDSGIITLRIPTAAMTITPSSWLGPALPTVATHLPPADQCPDELKPYLNVAKLAVGVCELRGFRPDIGAPSEDNCFIRITHRQSMFTVWVRTSSSTSNMATDSGGRMMLALELHARSEAQINAGQVRTGNAK